MIDCRLWIEKQEAGFSAWLNGVLVPAKAAEEGLGSQALAARRLAAKVRGLLWHLYSADHEVIATMLKVEKHIDAGQLRLRDEVSIPQMHCKKPKATAARFAVMLADSCRSAFALGLPPCSVPAGIGPAVQSCW